MDINTIATLAERLGFPALVLIGVGVGLYRAGVWFQPRVDKVVDATHTNAETLKVMAATGQIHHDAIKTALKEMKDRLDAIWELLSKEEGR